MRTLRKKIVRWKHDILELESGQAPPVKGWAVGPKGAFEDGEFVAATWTLRRGGPGSDRPHRSTELLIFEDE